MTYISFKLPVFSLTISPIRFSKYSYPESSSLIEERYYPRMKSKISPKLHTIFSWEGAGEGGEAVFLRMAMRAGLLLE